jgi:hypothetical protein
MALPFSRTATFELPRSNLANQDPEQLLSAVARALEKLKARNINQDVNTVSFNAGIFRLVSGSNLLVAIRSGRIELIPGAIEIRVSYSLRFTEIFFVTFLMVAGFLAPPTLKAPNLDHWQALMILAFAFIWLFGGNVVIALFRFPRFLRRTLQSVP